METLKGLVIEHLIDELADFIGEEIVLDELDSLLTERINSNGSVEFSIAVTFEKIVKFRHEYMEALNEYTSYSFVDMINVLEDPERADVVAYTIISMEVLSNLELDYINVDDSFDEVELTQELFDDIKEELENLDDGTPYTR